MVRIVLGAERRYLAKHFLAEMFVVVGTAGALGLVLAIAVERLLLALAPVALPRLVDVGIGSAEVGSWPCRCWGQDLPGLFPVARPTQVLPCCARGAWLDGLVAETVGTERVCRGSNGPVARAAHWSHVVVQSFRHLSDVHPGFDAHGVLTFGWSFRRALRDVRVGRRVLQDLTSRIESLRCESRGSTTSLPLSGFDGCSSVFVEGHDGEPPRLLVDVVTLASSALCAFRCMGVHRNGTTSRQAPPA